jgi:hypothetical protein
VLQSGDRTTFSRTPRFTLLYFARFALTRLNAGG